MDGLISVVGSLILLFVVFGFGILMAKLAFKVGMMILRFYIGLFMAPFRIMKWVAKPIWKAVAFEDVREATKDLPQLR